MKDVVGHEDLFSVTEDGQIFSKRSNRFLKLNLIGAGYLACVSKVGGRSGRNVVIKAHRAVALAYLPKVEGKGLVNHIDGNKLNNTLSNLEWCTHQENNQHAWDTGLQPPKKKSICGTTGKYYAGCRCTLCKDAYSVYRKARYKRDGV